MTLYLGSCDVCLELKALCPFSKALALFVQAPSFALWVAWFPLSVHFLKAWNVEYGIQEQEWQQHLLVGNRLTSGCLLCIKFKGIDRQWRTSLCWEWRGWSTHKNLWKHIKSLLKAYYNNVQNTLQPPAARGILLGQ